jgi:hypothetical protein
MSTSSRPAEWAVDADVTGCVAHRTVSLQLLCMSVAPTPYARKSARSSWRARLRPSEMRSNLDGAVGAAADAGRTAATTGELAWAVAGRPSSVGSPRRHAMGDALDALDAQVAQ